MAVPPKRLPIDSDSSVRMVTRQARMTLKTRVRVKGTPRARAPSTYGLPNSSRTVARTWRRYLADMAMARVSVGSAAAAGLTP